MLRKGIDYLSFEVVQENRNTFYVDKKGIPDNDDNDNSRYDLCSQYLTINLGVSYNNCKHDAGTLLLEVCKSKEDILTRSTDMVLDTEFLTEFENMGEITSVIISYLYVNTEYRHKGIGRHSIQGIQELLKYNRSIDVGLLLVDMDYSPFYPGEKFESEDDLRSVTENKRFLRNCGFKTFPPNKCTYFKKL
jgi:GNAT superfamily N-acetyltransferase